MGSERMHFEAVTAWLVALLLGLAQALGGDGGEDPAPPPGPPGSVLLQPVSEEELLQKVKLSQLPSDQVLLQDWEYYNNNIAPVLIQKVAEEPVTYQPPNSDGRDGCPAEQPSFFWSCDRPRWQGCGYGEECCCGKCHPKFMVYCKDDGYWGKPFFHDACLAGCPTQPTTTTSTETPELDLQLAPELQLTPELALQ